MNSVKTNHRVLLVTQTERIAGAERVVENLYHQCSVKPTIANGTPDVMEYFETSGWPCRKISKFQLLSSYKGFYDLVTSLYVACSDLRKIHHELKPDYVHVMNIASLLFVRIALGRKAQPVFLHTQDYYVDHGKVIRNFAKLLKNYPQGIIAASEDVRKSLLDIGFPSEKTKTIHSGVAWKDKISKPTRGPIRVLFCGYFEERKGLVEGLNILATSTEETSAIEVNIVGEIPSSGYRKKVEALIISKGLNAQLHGHSNRPESYFENADIFFHLPKEKDPFPTVILEAMRANCAIVTNQMGGMPEALHKDCGVILATSPTENATITELRRLLSDRILVIQAGEAARKRFEESYTNAAFYNRFMEFLKARATS